MSRLLAIETTGSVCGAAISIDGTLIACTEVVRSNVHDELLAEIVTETCRLADVALQDVNVVAVSSGPGSFTGLRIGASFAKGLCFSSQSSLLSVPTHQALMAASMEVAQQAGKTKIFSCIPSHGDLLYVSSCGPDLFDVYSPLDICSIDETQAMLSCDSLVVGPGAGLVIDSPISGLNRLSPRFVAYAAWLLMAKGVPFVDADTFVPNYHQDFKPR